METWVDIREFEGYQVSDQGRVRSLDRVLHHEQHGMIVTRKHKGKILSQNNNGHGYLSVQLGRGARQYVHRLVADHFIPNPDGHEEINHINANKGDNRALNLQWCTRQQNIDHSVEMDLRCKGSRVHAALLDEGKVQEIKRLIDSGSLRQADIAKQFEVSIKCISDINCGYTWKHVR